MTADTLPLFQEAVKPNRTRTNGPRDLTPEEAARAIELYQTLNPETGRPYTQREIARLFGKWKGYVQEALQAVGFRNRPRTYTRRPLVERCWERVNKNGSVPSHRPELGRCWVWTGSTVFGYGVIGRGGAGSGNFQAHRVSWQFNFGTIPDGLFVLHSCDVRACVRPDHLFLGTQADNMADMWDKGRGYTNGSMPGEQNPRARMTVDDVRLIRALAKDGWQTHQLANRFGLAPAHIRRIVRGLAWTIIPLED